MTTSPKRKLPAPVWKMEPTTPLFLGRTECHLSYSPLRPPKERPASRAIWAGASAYEWGTLATSPPPPTVAQLAVTHPWDASSPLEATLQPGSRSTKDRSNTELLLKSETSLPAVGGRCGVWRWKLA